jgi:hypothetical protein
MEFFDLRNAAVLGARVDSKESEMGLVGDKSFEIMIIL